MTIHLQVGGPHPADRPLEIYPVKISAPFHKKFNFKSG